MPEYWALREKISGVYSAATKCGWHIFQTTQRPPPTAIRKIKHMLNPIGFIYRPVAIPDEMAVVSVDGIHEICLNVTPNLTSVNLNFFQCGENAVELLKRRLQDPSRPLETLTYGVVTVSKRASTRKPHTDKRVTKAVEFIANNITSHISSLHVIKEMGCGRRQAEQLFKHHTGISILQAI